MRIPTDGLQDRKKISQKSLCVTLCLLCALCVMDLNYRRRLRSPGNKNLSVTLCLLCELCVIDLNHRQRAWNPSPCNRSAIHVIKMLRQESKTKNRCPGHQHVRCTIEIQRHLKKNRHADAQRAQDAEDHFEFLM